jgi:Domain of unknown function (DUF4902)
MSNNYFDISLATHSLSYLTAQIHTQTVTLQKFNNARDNGRQRTSHCPSWRKGALMLRVSDYEPVRVPLVSLSQLQYLHWRTEWQSSQPYEPPSEFVRVNGAGTSMWEVSVATQMVWLSWDWLSLNSGVIALTNPLDVRSNAILLDDNDRLLPLHASTAILASIAHKLPWRYEVERLMKTTPALLH